MTPAEIARQLALFVGPGCWTELRALHVGQKGRTFAGWFDAGHLEELARQALALARQAAGVYFVPNPVDPAVAAKRPNRVLDVHRGFGLTHDADVVERRHLIVDLDPRRVVFDAAGEYRPDQNVPSSARELAFARRVADRHVRPFLAALGFRPPVVMLSGNGVHLVYQVEPTPGGKCGPHDHLGRLLQLLHGQFSCYGVTVDPDTYTPARMLKVPGTTVRKGESSRYRPHRVARIIETPDGWLQPAPGPAPTSERRQDPRHPVTRVEQPPAKPAAPATERPTLFEPGGRRTPGH